MTKTPEQMAEKVAHIRRHRATTSGFDVALTGYSTPADRRLTQEFAAAGVTWWLESLHGSRGSFDELMARVEAGPPA